MRIIGIDPGANGGMACIIGSSIDLFKFEGATEKDIADRIADWAEDSDTLAILERVGPSRSQDGGSRVQGVSGVFAFGQGYGFLRGVLTALEIPFETVMPVVWQRSFSLTRTDKAEGITAKKNRHKARAQQLFPALKITHAYADALLIAEYGRRTFAAAKPF